MTLLLDGLDEVAERYRPACVAALNTWRAEHGLVPLVVCSRTAEYQALMTAVRVEEAVELQPPTDQEVDIYLRHLEGTGTPLTDIRAAQSSDRELHELLHSPLMLHVVALAYHGRSASALQEPGTVQARQARLWDAYVARMFEQRPLDRNSSYTPEQAHSWLEWLAQALHNRDQTEFHLDRLTPEWLSTHAEQSGARVVISLGVALSTWLIVLLCSVLGGSGVVAGMGFATGGALVAWGFAGAVGELRPTERMHWSWRELRRNWARRLAVGILASLGVGIGTGCTYGLLEGLGAGLVAGLVVALAVGLTVGVGAALSGGLVSELRDERTTPNEGIRRSARSALAVGLAVGLFGGLGIWLGASLVTKLLGGPLGSVAVLIALTFGVLGGLIAGLLYGGRACLQHYTVRAALVRANAGPWRYGQFLDAMTHRLLLRRSADAYLFTHRLLRDHLALTSSVKPARSRTGTRP